MGICGEPGLYNDCDDVGPEDLMWCSLPTGHHGAHQYGGVKWGRMQDLTFPEKLDLLGVDDDGNDGGSEGWGYR